MTNQQVKQAFMERRSGHSQNLVSTGESLLSYGWWQVAKWVDGRIVVRNGKSYSRTTASKHRSGVAGERAKVETPVHQAEMNV